MKSIYKKILSIGLIATALGFLPTTQAHAALFGIGDIASTAITGASTVILGVFKFIAQAFFVVAGFLLELAMKLNNGILDSSANGNVFVFKGWTVFVNVADLALVVGLIVIAFATMLNFESYGMKKTLPKLIIVALLVNFSLVIPGVLVDLSGMVTDFFVQQAGLTGSGMGKSLATAFNISGFMSTSQLATSTASTIGAAGAKLTFGTMNIILNMVFIVVFTAIATVILLTLAAMFFIRYFMLSFLLLLTPIVFVMWIFPGTKQYWTEWWNRFIRWTMFPPVMVFFMWLSLTALNAPTAVEGTSSGSAWDMAQGLMNFNISALVHMAMAVMFMILSLIAANSISISGAKGSDDMIKSLTGWSQGKIQGWGKGAQAYGRRESVRQSQRLARVPAMGAAIGAGAASLRKFEGEKGGLLGYGAGKLGRAGERISAAQQASIRKAFDEKFKGMSDDNLASRYSTMSTDERAFAAQRLAKSGKLNKVNDKILDRDISAENAKATFDKYGGEGTYDKITKASGRNADMINAKRGIDEADKLPAGAGKTDKVYEAKKKYKDASTKFYDGLSRKDFESLGSKFYSSGVYGEEALKGLLRKEPGAFGKIVAGLDSRADVEKFNTNAIEVIKSMKEEALAIVKSAHGNEVGVETNKELLTVMKEMKDFDKERAEKMDLKEKLKWIEERDAKAHVALGGEKLADDFEQQVRVLIEKKNSTVVNMEEVEDYQKTIRTINSMRKSIGKRLYSEGEEKKA